MKKNVIGMLAVGSMCALTLSACGGGDSEKKASSGSGNELTAVVVKHSLTKKNKDMEWLTKLEKDLDVKIKWEEVSADWDQKKSPMLASGDVPDLIIGHNIVADTEFAKFPGLFADFNDYMDKLPNVQKMFEEKPQTEAISTQLDGKILGLPKYQRFWPISASRQYINQEWLDNVGMEAPTTWDELYAVLLAFKEQDANGNGDANDEIPMDWSPVGTGGFGYFQPMQLLASTGIVPSGGGNQGYFAEDGVVKSFFTDERYKETIEFLNQCWKAGLINSKAFSQDYSAYQSTGRGDGDDAKVGFTWGWEASDRFGTKIADQYTSLAPLAQKAGMTPTWSYEWDLNYAPNCVVMSANTKNKDKALEFINALYDPEIGLQELFGSIGPNIEKDGDKYTILPPADENVDPGTWKWTSTWADNSPKYIADSLDVTLGKDMQDVQEQDKALHPYVDDIVPEKSVIPVGMMKFEDADATTLSNNNTTILNEAMTKFAKWITEGGIEEDWDAYVKTLNSAGLEENCKIVQKGFNQFYGLD